MSRLQERSAVRLMRTKGMAVIILGLIVFVVLVSVVLELAATWFVLQGDLEAWRDAQVALNAFAIMVDIIIVFLAWTILGTLDRMEREADRLQQFMDNVYRRMP